MFANNNDAARRWRSMMNTAIHAAVIGFCIFKPALPVEGDLDYLQLISSQSSSHAMAA